MPKLLIFTQPPTNTNILEGSTSIGRSPACDASINDPSVSKRHALITYQEMNDGGFKTQITDLHSTNGTFVNGKRVKYQRLSDGDQISVGTVQCSFVENS